MPQRRASRGSRRRIARLLLGALLMGGTLSGVAQAKERPTTLPGPKPVPARMTVADARTAAARCYGYLLETQRTDGAWAVAVPGTTNEASFSVETHHCWKFASTGLACMAMMRQSHVEAHRKALRRGVRWLATTRIPKRGSSWDTDYMWSALYGVVALTEAIEHPALAREGLLRTEAGVRARALIDILVRNQEPLGGWAYYDNSPATRRNKWGTSFCTALVLPALATAKRLGWLSDQGVIDRATRYVARCRLPNGAYTYDLTPVPWIRGGEGINRVKGSLGRIQVCNWALKQLEHPKLTIEHVRTGLGQMLEHHRFLDVARMRPIPHEGYYANAGYFYCFAHYYAACAIALLPADEHETWHARLRPHLVKTLRKNGSTSDFLHAEYMVVASTSYTAMALAMGLPSEGDAASESGSEDPDPLDPADKAGE